MKSMKKPLLVLATLLIVAGSFARTLEVDVHGMTCAFCADSLDRQFSAMSAVSKVDISLKNKKIRLQTAPDSPTIEAIKQTILDAGFTPVKVTEIKDGATTD